MFPSGVTDLPADCCFTIKIPTKHVGLIIIISLKSNLFPSWYS